MHIGKGKFPLCAIRSLLAYLSLRGNDPGPLFLFCNGQALTCATLSSWLRNILALVGIHSNFSSHSFHIGAGIVASRNGISRVLGCWTSTAYLSYIRIPVESLLQLSKQLESSAALCCFSRPHRTCSDGAASATGVVLSAFFSGLGFWCLEGLVGLGSTSTPVRGPFTMAATHSDVMDTPTGSAQIAHGSTILSRHHSPSLSIVDEFNLTDAV